MPMLDALIYGLRDVLDAGFTALSRKSRLQAGAGLTATVDDVNDCIRLDATLSTTVTANPDGSIVVVANEVGVGVLASDAQHGVRGGGTTHADVVAAGASGFMSGSMATKVNGLQNGFLLFGNQTVNQSTTTRYLTPGYSDTAAGTNIAQIVSPIAGSLRKFYVMHNTTAGNGNAIVYTVRINGVATALAVSLASTSTGGSDLVDTVAIAVGDRIDIEVTKLIAVVTSPSDVTATMELAA